MTDVILKGKIETATGPSRELDAEIMQALFPDAAFINGGPKLTASVDAALTLVERVLPGTWVEGSLASPACLEIHRPGHWEYLGQGRAATPALAILSALMSALLSKEADHD